MVERLLAAGHQVTGFNRTRSKAQKLLRAGMIWGETPRAVAESAETRLEEEVVVTKDGAVWSLWIIPK